VAAVVEETTAEPAEASRATEPAESLEDRIAGLTSDIFISYAREDRAVASALAEALVGRGWKVWWDRKIAPGEAFDVVIERELSTCKCAVVLWSTNSVNATWVRNEARRASRRRVLVPILIEQVETPLEFENLQAADLTSWDESANHPELETVFNRIQALSPIPYDRLKKRKEEARRAAEAARREQALAAEKAAAERRREAEAAERRREAEAQERRREAEATARRKEAEEEQRRQTAEAALRQREAEATERRRETERQQEAERQRAIAEEKARIEARVEAERIERKRAKADRLKAEAQRFSEVADETTRPNEMPLATADAGAHVDVPIPKPPRSTSRLVQVSIALAILALVGALSFLRIWPARIPEADSRPPQNPIARRTPPEPTATVRTPAVETAATTTPAAALAPEIPPAPAPVARNDSRESPTVKPSAPPARLEELRTRALAQEQSGERAQALNTVVEGLQIASQESAGAAGEMAGLVYFDRRRDRSGVRCREGVFFS